MAAETQTLNFGPEWLRALSRGGSITSPPLSPALPKYKLADYRYGREEMLALYEKYLKVPVDLTDKEFIPILQEEPLPPLALVSFTEEEQRNFSMSVNSAAVLRLMGRGGGTVVGAARGRSSSRGRGRGRGESGFYQRSFDEGEVGFGRGVREMHRSQSWEERGERRFDKPGRKDPGLNHPKDQHSNLGAPSDFLSTSGFPLKSGRTTFEEMGTSSTRKHEFTRSESENWRVCRDEQNGEDDDGGWRLTGHRREGDGWQPHSAGVRAGQVSWPAHIKGWREAMERRRRFEFDYRDRDDERNYRRVRSGGSGVDDEKDCLPEWCLEDAEEEMGTFDSSGAFMSLKKTSKEPIPEEQELDFKQMEDGEERLNSEESEKEAKEPDKNTKKEIDEEINKTEESKNVACGTSPTPPPEPEIAMVSSPPKKEENKPEKNEDAQQSRSASEETSSSSNRKSPALPRNHSPTAAVADASSVSPPSTPSTMANRNIPQDNDDDEGLKHLEQEAEKMVASLQDNVIEDERLSTQIQEQRTKSATLPLSHEAAMKWFYKDPQGEIQGSFTNQEMAEWFQAGYFTMSLLVKRGCDEGFQPLGEVIKMWGRVPFAPGASPPPLLSDLDQERLKRQQELATLNLYQMQQIQYQQFLQAQLMTRQQYAQAIAHHQKAAVGAITSQQQPQQQQQQQQLAAILEQFQALKLRSSEQSLIPPVTRSMTVPDSNSIWELQTPQASGWDCDSVWDLPVDSSTQGSSVDQIQQMERGKGAKLEQERRETENRAKREEEEKKQEEIRRHQEEVLRRQEEEKKRREEEQLMRKKQEEALRRQREHEAALRRQREEEERQQEAAHRRHEERQKEEEERRQREELLRKQEEERRRKDEEAARWLMEEEARRRAEEDNRLKIEEENRLRLEEEEQKRKDLERHKEMQKQEAMRQRQQQQEALRRLQQQQQQQLAQMKLPSSSTWGQQSSSVSSQSQGTLSLAEIQKLEEERERQLQEERRQQQSLMKALQQQQNQQQKLTGWGNIPKASVTTKSLLEIQQEEFRQMQKQKENRSQLRTSAAMKLNVSGNHEESSHKNTTAIKREESSHKRSERNQHSSLPVSTTSAWGSVNTSPTNQWGTDINSVWGAPDNKNTNVGFWDEAVKEVGPTAKKQTSKNNKNNSNPGKSHGVQNKPNKKAEEEEKLMKLFHGVNKAQDGFTLWCEQMLQVLNTANNLDVPTFVSFLKEVDSQYEVHDYIRAYLGDTPETKEFAKQFLGRRAKQRQLQHQVGTDSGISEIQMTGLESIYPSNHSRNRQPNFECVQAGKRKKKQKMIRADPSILGFSVNASSERLNMGEIETLDDY